MSAPSSRVSSTSHTTRSQPRKHAVSFSDKDVWDRITSLAAILIPAAIALAGYFIGQAIKDAEIASQEKRADLDRALARESVRVSQANLINTLMKSLTSVNPQERQLAVQAVIIALPEEGPALARTIEQTDKDKSVQEAARNSIDQRIETLLQDLFASDASTRITAAQQIIQGWRNDPGAVDAIISFAKSHPSNENGIFNAVVVLSEFNASALKTHRAQVIAFAEQAKGAGPNTAARAAVLLSRLGPNPA
ncbi:hypothetical protein [Citrobacter enshiensis]|uniref:HEAT repeat domain-containing protein n=1 Tax=Citrobacter enshiensis TaxID=2971264 RepID=A0ABT8PTV9_9ENTR|nr:hypothetical protein [Citrobacter enshiensis]MDN8599770.1 hypothetical protein [Citrobacter enshiensis]WET39222.1 hypothetical protein P2W74_14620 [Citrobacter enshiensis]